MTHVRVEQRNAHLACPVRFEYLIHRDGESRLAMAVLTAISNTLRGSGEAREEESSAVQWTLWGKLAESAHQYLAKGSHVNIVGHLRNNKYQDKTGADVYAFGFIAEEVDFLDSRAEAERRVTERHDKHLDAVSSDEGRSHPSLSPTERRDRSATNPSAVQAPR